MRTGFSLVELSIVLVILGLLTGGILAGQSLIRASELRSITSDYQRHLTAMYTYRDKYFEMPGDHSTATAFFGKDNTNCSGHAGTAATPGTCNGNGNGRITWCGESFLGWQHMARAGLVEGTFNPFVNGTCHAIPGTNVMGSKISSAGFNYYQSDTTFNANEAGPSILLIFGKQAATSSSDAAALKPEEAWNIDTKMDDGKPRQGRMYAYGAGCYSDADNYALSTSTLACALGWFLGPK